MNISSFVKPFVTIGSYLRNFIDMFKRRTSKRFVLGDTSVDEAKYDDEATDIMPSNLVQKFQMTLDSDPGKTDKEDACATNQQDRKLLRLPTPTLQ